MPVQNCLKRKYAPSLSFVLYAAIFEERVNIFIWFLSEKQWKRILPIIYDYSKSCSNLSLVHPLKTCGLTFVRSFKKNLNFSLKSLKVANRHISFVIDTPTYSLMLVFVVAIRHRIRIGATSRLRYSKENPFNSPCSCVYRAISRNYLTTFVKMLHRFIISFFECKFNFYMNW